MQQPSNRCTCRRIIATVLSAVGAVLLICFLPCWAFLVLLGAALILLAWKLLC